VDVQYRLTSHAVYVSTSFGLFQRFVEITRSTGRVGAVSGRHSNVARFSSLILVFAARVGGRR
jgi:hypothetical protein